MLAIELYLAIFVQLESLLSIKVDRSVPHILCFLIDHATLSTVNNSVAIGRIDFLVIDFQTNDRFANLRLGLLLILRQIVLFNLLGFGLLIDTALNSGSIVVCDSKISTASTILR